MMLYPLKLICNHSSTRRTDPENSNKSSLFIGGENILNNDPLYSVSHLTAQVFGFFLVFWIFISELQCTEKAYLHLSVWCCFARTNPRRLVPASVLAGMCEVRSRLQRPTMQRDEITSEGRAVLASCLLCRYSLRSLASVVLFFPH